MKKLCLYHDRDLPSKKYLYDWALLYYRTFSKANFNILCTLFENLIHCVGEYWLDGDAYMQYVSYLLRTYMYIAKKMHSSFSGLGKYNFMVHFTSSVCVSENGHMFLRHMLQ